MDSRARTALRCGDSDQNSKVEPWNGALSYIDRELLSLEQSLARSCLPRGDEVVDDTLGFTENAEIGLPIYMRGRGHGRPADSYRFLVQMA